MLQGKTVNKYYVYKIIKCPETGRDEIYVYIDDAKMWRVKHNHIQDWLYATTGYHYNGWQIYYENDLDDKPVLGITGTLEAYKKNIRSK